MRRAAGSFGHTAVAASGVALRLAAALQCPALAPVVFAEPLKPIMWATPSPKKRGEERQAQQEQNAKDKK